MARTLTFGARVKQLREAKKISVEDLARKAGLHPMAVYKIEDGQRANPRIDTALALARGLGVSPGELLEGVR